MKHSEFNPASLSLDDAAEQCPLDINRHGVDQTRCILGTIFMTWPKENQMTVIASVRASNKEIQRFEILFKTSINDSLSTLTLSPHDEFRLSLYGAELEKLARIPKICSLAFKLVYTKGVLIEWKPRGSEEMCKLNTWICTLFHFSVVFSLFLSFNSHAVGCTLVETDEASNPDNAWYGTPSATILQSKRKQDEDEATPLEETRPRRNKEEQKRRRVEAKKAKLQKSKPVVVNEEMEVSEPVTPLAAMSVQNDDPQLPQFPSSPLTIISRTSPHEEQLSGGSVEIQASFRVDGVSMRL